MLNSSAAVWAAEQPFFILLLLCYPQTWQHLSGVWHSPHQTKHNRPAFILLLNCEGLLTAPSQSLSPHAEGTARSFHYQSALKAARNQRGFVGYLSTVATTTTTSSILPVFVLYTFDHTLRCQPATLPWNRFIAKTLFCGMISILSVQYFTHPSVLYPHRMNTGASAKNSTRVYSCTNMIRALTTTLHGLLYKPFHLFLEVQKPIVDTQTDKSTPSTSVSSSSVSDPDPGLCPQGILLTPHNRRNLRIQEQIGPTGTLSIFSERKGKSFEPRFSSSHFLWLKEVVVGARAQS